MFEPTDDPRVFALPPGTDFAAELLDGLRARLAGQPPDALARVQIIVNTRRTARRLQALFDAGPACLLPRIGLVTDLGDTWSRGRIPPPVPPLERRLELAQVVGRLLDREPDLAPRAALYDLADSLAALMDEMHGEGVTPGAIKGLDISDQSGHWARISRFLEILRPYFEAASDAPDTEARQRMVVEDLTARWRTAPPDHPVIVAGSTGSRGATRLLMQAVARLPLGAVVLPGFDFDMPEAVWGALDDPLLAEDHPQHRFHAFLRALDLPVGRVRRWTGTAPAVPPRNRVMSLALRPAPVTDQWLRDGPQLEDIAEAMADVTLLEAPSLRQEALAIAMRLRQAAEDGQTAALVTPDRTLTRQVTAALDQWNILPDDSAGMPLHLSPPGRFLRHVADLFHNRLTAESLLTLLKHPLCHGGSERSAHLLFTRELELYLRRHGPPHPGAADLRAWANARPEPAATAWADWLGDLCGAGEEPGERPFPDRVRAHLDLAEHLARGPGEAGSGDLWAGEAGRQARAAVDALADAAPRGGSVTARDYASLFTSILSRHEVHRAVGAHPLIHIWGTLEARVQGADLMILAGLNEGTWPEAPTPDPWLNRTLRHRTGLLLPERRIGLSAHDFQQAALAREVWLTRSVRSEDAQTLPARWLNRIVNLLDGLPRQGGQRALSEMRGRGRDWLDRAASLELPPRTDPEPRPAPCPPPGHRPRELPVTAIQRLIRDPYAIYARYVLRLRPLDPLMRVPDALLRGTVLHEILERFVALSRDDPELCSRALLLETAERLLEDSVPWAGARAIWRARLERVADWIIETEAQRRQRARPAALEVGGALDLDAPAFRLTAKADRIDRDAGGRVWLYDYKTGTPPGPKEQRLFDKQLLLEAVIAEQAGFGDIGPAPVAGAAYIGLGTTPAECAAPLDETPTGQVLSEFRDLITAYSRHEQGYTARRMPRTVTEPGDYDHLARFGEWDAGSEPVKTWLT